MKQQFSNPVVSTMIFSASIITSTALFAQSNANVSVMNSPNPINPIIVTATRTPVPSNDVLADFTYISQEEISQAAQTSLPDLLQQQRGIQISNTGGSGNVSSVYIRGTNNGQSLVLVDGVRMDSSGGGALWNSIPLSLIDHIEIIYGPQSTFYGSDAMGGVIQIFTKNGQGPTQLNITSGYGSYNTSINNASIAGSLQDTNKTSYSLGISQENSAGFNTVANNNRGNASGSNYRGFGALPIAATAYTRVGANGQLSQVWAKGQEFGLTIFASKNNWQYPNSDYLDSNYSISADYTARPMGDSQVNTLFVASAYSKNQITEQWQSLVQVSSTTNNAQNFTLNSNDKLTTPGYDFLWQNNIVIGEDILQILGESRQQYAYQSNSPYQTAGCSNDCIVSQKRTTDSVASSYQLRRGGNLATLAIRNDNITNYGSKLTWSAAYGYFFTKEWRANMNYGTGFRAPSFNDLYYPGYGNQNLKPETNRNIEVGIHYEKKIYNIHLVAYQNRIENFIVPINCDATCPPANYSWSYPANFSLVQIKGASLGADARMGNLTIKGSADAMSTVDQTTGLDVPNRANWVGNLSVEYQIKKINLGGNTTLSGQRWGGVNTTGTANIQQMPTYTIFNLYASYEFDKNWTTFARWNNVFGSQYQTSYGYANAGSNVFAGVRYAMK